MVARRFVVSGRVQGVGYRAFVATVAESMGLAGEVWNRRDGGVEVVASHIDPKVLQSFEERLRRGPGRVESVHSEEAPYRVGIHDFSIGASR